MKYSVEVEIRKPLDEVVALFADRDNYSEWMEGLLSVEQKKGAPGAQGAESIFRFKMGKGEMEMTERVLENRLPELYSVEYTTDGVRNVVESRFSDAGDGTTRYSTLNEFRFQGLMMRLIGALMPGSFRRQSQKYLKEFKRFVESRPDEKKPDAVTV